MNPYEAILNGSSVSRSTQKKKTPPRTEGAPASASSSQSGVLSRATKRRAIAKPRQRLSVRYRYQFDLPSPTMDNMMLMGRLHPDSFASPISISLERMALPPIVPADPCYGLSANLLDTSQYRTPAKLTLDDEALLLNIESQRPSAYLTDPARRSAHKLSGGLPAPRRSLQAPAPWMRRMGYDEYFGRSSSSVRPMSRKVNANGPTALSALRPQLIKSINNRKAARTIERSFILADKLPRHPGKRSSKLKPVKITPLFLDMQEFGKEYISIEFDRSAKVTHDNRSSDPDLFEKSKRAMATISLAGEDDKKFLACYTPSDETLGEMNNDSDSDMGDEKRKELVYDWVHEYGIREANKYSLTGMRRGVQKPPRSVYALREFSGTDGNKRIATLSRVGVSWKLTQRLGTLPQLGKPHLKIDSVQLSQSDEARDLEKGLSSINN